jgi:hypothetical protein
MVDLTFRASGEDFVILAHTEVGESWLFDRIGFISTDRDGRGSVSIETRSALDDLQAKAVAAGLTVASA